MCATYAAYSLVASNAFTYASAHCRADNKARAHSVQPMEGASTMWDSEDTRFEVVMNAEEQYSIWPATMDVPAGWSTVGKAGTKQECLAYIEEVWTDMRPLSLRRHVDGTTGV
ncbi:MbtH family NRPS accessory protein [Xanthomonas citri]|nr:MbtH family NRPS accessory protein [Xanthomonas citri]